MKSVFSLKWWAILCLVLPALVSGCEQMPFISKEPVVLTLWHVYGGQTNSPLNDMVDRFNQTVGLREGITVNVTSISNSTAIHFALVAAAKKLPGAAELPDMFVAYPKTALAIGPERLMDWKDHLGEKKRKAFVPSFLSEGMVNNRLTLLPVAKSSSALFINATIFDQFSRETGIQYSDLATWEGMFTAAKRYHQWSGGKSFFKYDDWMHYGMVNTASLGGTFFRENAINFQDGVFRNIWNTLAKAALSGEVSLFGGYSTTDMMTGEIVCGIESTAAILYFKDKVTFPDNTTAPLRLKVLPVPHFAKGKPLAIQRGGGLGVVQSTKRKDRAAAVFGEWLTAAENNVPFVVKTGYFPVTTDAYKDFFAKYSSGLPHEGYRELYTAMLAIQNAYTFYIPPFFENYGEVEKRFSDAQLALFKKYRGKIELDHVQFEAFLYDMFIELQDSVQ